MTAPKKPTIPEVFDRFNVYHQQHGAWGVLHVVLDDGNHEDHFLEGLPERARAAGDEEGAQLAELLQLMSRTQRRKLSALRERGNWNGTENLADPLQEQVHADQEQA